MNVKFGECVFVERERDTFLEYESSIDLVDDQGEKALESMLGYFPPYTNVTYNEIDDYREDTIWIVAYHQKTNSCYTNSALLSFPNTNALKEKLDAIIEDTYEGEEYVTIFRANDLVYL